MLQGWRRWVGTPDVAVDVGTGTTRLSFGRRMRTLERPSVITAVEAARRGRAVGTASSAAHAAVPALRAGVVIDAEAAAMVLSTLLRRARGLGLRKPRVLACAPTDASEAERSALIESISLAGGIPVQVAPEPLAAAIGAGIDMTASSARMVIDIGEGVTDVAVIRRGQLVHAGAIRIACGDLHAAIATTVQERYDTALSPAACARLTRIIGAVYPRALPSHLPVTIGDAGDDERQIVVATQDLWRAVDPVYERIVGHVLSVLHALPEPCYRQVANGGLRVTGGGALVRGLSDRVVAATRINTTASEYPLQAVISGAMWMVARGGAALLPAVAAVDRV